MRRLTLAVALTVILAGSGAHGQTGSGPQPAVAQAAPETPDAALTRARTENEAAQARYYGKEADRQPSSGPPAWLQTVIGGLIAIAGSVGTLLLTTRMAENKTRQERQQTYDRHEHQLRLAVNELRESLGRLGPELPGWVDEGLVYEEPRRPAVPSRTDRYYLKYDLVDCVYRLCALLGWLELYRTDSCFLRGSSPAKQGQVERYFAEIRRDLADDLLDVKAGMGATGLRDGFILADDQRAIGEQMLDRDRSEVVGYAAFCERLFCSPKRDDPTGWAVAEHQNWWVWNVTRFIVELRPEGGDLSNAPATATQHTFALTRVARLEGHCADLAGLLGHSSLQPG